MGIVTVRDEKHAAIMAHGYAQVTGRPGVCSATFGPGAANLLTGLLEAQKSSVPVIALVQDHPLQVKDRHPSSGLDHAAILRPFTKAVVRIDFPEQTADVVRKAFRLATTGRPGPVALLCPSDVMASETECDTRAEPAYAQWPANRVRANRRRSQRRAGRWRWLNAPCSSPAAASLSPAPWSRYRLWRSNSLCQSLPR